MNKILINTSNLHVGGGVQVAVSFINELSNSGTNLKIYDIWLSSEVFKNLIEIGCNLSNFNSFKIINFYGIRSLFSINLLYNVIFVYNTVFTVFGPLYSFVKPKKHVMGFAQPSIIYPDIAINLYSNKLIQFKLFFKLKIQELFFSKVDHLIVELEHVRAKLLLKKRFNNITVSVVHNCFSNVFLNPEQWQIFSLPNSNRVKIGYLGRNYLHKNLEILPEVLFLLRDNYNMDVDFYVTLTDFEWESSSVIFRKSIINVGKLSIAQCPSYISQLDGVIFPSLLECFSATPLEALVMGKPVFLSNRHFNSDVVLDFGFYFDPLNPFQIAEVISNYFLGFNDIKHNSDNFKMHALNFSNSKSRMQEYIKILNT